MATATVPIVFQYETSTGDKRTDKGGKAALWKQNDKFFLLTVKQVATYSDIRADETLKQVSLPQLRPAKSGKRNLAYVPLGDVDIPTWTEVPVDDEEFLIPVTEDEKSVNLKSHDSIYYLEVTSKSWATSAQYTHLTETTVNVNIGDRLQFCTQKRLGTGFLAEYPQLRPVAEVLGKETNYPGRGNEFYTVSSHSYIAPPNVKDCKSAQVTFAFPSSLLSDYCYFPPMFLIDANIRNSNYGWPLINQDKELVGLISQPIFYDDGKTICKPGTWVCSIPAGLELGKPPRQIEDEETKAEDSKGDGSNIIISESNPANNSNSAPKKKKKKNKKKKKK